MTERRGTKALELWCRRITDGYPGVNVQNMTTSWRDGLAFCAMIHHFRPDLVDFDSLNKDDVYGNNELAFRTAAEHLGIPALLDAEDMASCSVPDRLSILTYLSQFYQSFGGSSPSRLALSRTKESSDEEITPVVAESTTPKVGPRMGIRREACAVCGMPVFLAEKLVISRTPYHRTCFRCARCANQLTPGNYYETVDGQYCCETCPDEEKKSSSSPLAPIFHQAYNETMMLGRENLNRKNVNQTDGYQRSLSDEEKTERRAQLASEILDRVSRDDEPIEKSSKPENQRSQTAQMRLSFMANHLLSEKHDGNTKYLSRNDEECPTDADDAVTMRINDSSSSSPRDGLQNRRDPKGSLFEENNGDERVDEMPYRRKNERRPIKIETNIEISECSDSVSDVAPIDETEVKSVNLDVKLEDNDNNDEITKRFDTATEEAREVKNNHYSHLDDKENSIGRDTKDKIGPDINVEASKQHEDLHYDNGESLSLVQRRLKMFESTTIDEQPKEQSRVVSSPGTIFGREISEKNLYLSNDTIAREILKSCSSVTDSTIAEEDKKQRNEKIVSSNEIPTETDDLIPPVVPKRSNIKVRRADKSKEAKKPDVTVLNASGIDLSDEENYPKDLNPFGNDDERNEEADGSHEKSRSSRVSTNPFGSSEEDDEESIKIVAPPRPASRNIPKVTGKALESIEDDKNETPTKRRLKAPQINLNPFWSDDDEDHESEDEVRTPSLTGSTPVPKPRTIKQTPDSFLSPWKSQGEIYTSNSSLASTGSTSTPGGTCRKKKSAPPPPTVKELFTSGGDFRPLSNTYTGSCNSLRSTPRARKSKPAPPPPMPTSTPCSTNVIANLTLAESPITNSGKATECHDYEIWEDPKNGKDETNRNRQQCVTTLSCDETSSYDAAYTDKSAQGKWKRKKGPAPARPIPQRRKIKVMSIKDVKLELDEIEMQQQGLEKQGVRLEQLIRDKAETGNVTEDMTLGMDVEELVLELFALVNEKNELFRRQAELMLLRRQQRLEEEHADIEYQIRCLLCQPEATKTDFDKQKEETLIQRLVEIVERRNEIVECLEMDRRREVEEDRSINTRMGIYAAKTKGEFAEERDGDEKNRSRKSKKTKLKEKAKEKILRKVHKKQDADKDVDETEVKLKRQNKKKWF